VRHAGVIGVNREQLLQYRSSLFSVGKGLVMVRF